MHILLYSSTLCVVEISDQSDVHVSGKCPGCLKYITVFFFFYFDPTALLRPECANELQIPDAKQKKKKLRV